MPITTTPEDKLAEAINRALLPAPIRQAMFARPERRFRADFCWPEYGLIVEVQGGGWVGGRHHKAAGYMADCERLYEAMRRGWRVLYVVPDHIDSGEAIKWIRELLPMGGSVELPEQPVPKGQKG